MVWSEVDFEAGTVEITSTIVRVKGEGLLRKGTKSRGGERVLPLPASAVAVLRRRFMSGARLDQPVFPDTLAASGIRPTSDASSREAGSEDLSWITSHTFRKTAATILDEAALSARLVADQLGHARPSMTQDVYLARRAVGHAGGAGAGRRRSGRCARAVKSMAKAWHRPKRTRSAAEGR